MSTLGARSILRIDLAADSELLESKRIASRSSSSLNVKDNIPKTAWEVHILYDIIICEGTASECLAYAHTAHNIVQI
jgi:hypothetical protein